MSNLDIELAYRKAYECLNAPNPLAIARLLVEILDYAAKQAKSNRGHKLAEFAPAVLVLHKLADLLGYNVCKAIGENDSQAVFASAYYTAKAHREDKTAVYACGCHKYTLTNGVLYGRHCPDCNVPFRAICVKGSQHHTDIVNSGNWRWMLC